MHSGHCAELDEQYQHIYLQSERTAATACGTVMQPKREQFIAEMLTWFCSRENVLIRYNDNAMPIGTRKSKRKIKSFTPVIEVIM